MAEHNEPIRLILDVSELIEDSKRAREAFRQLDEELGDA